MKKLATYLALTAVVANMGVAAVFAQETAPVFGTQDIDCPTLVRAFGTGVNAPNDFQIGSTGARTVSSSNDTVAAYSETLQSAYFDETAPRVFSDTTDTMTISYNVPFSCGSASTRNISLTVAADRFNNGSVDLMTYGSDAAIDGTDSAADYYYIFSVNTSAPAACTGSCVLASGSTEPVNAAFSGISNGFASAGPHNLAQTSGDADALLHSSNGTANTVTLYTATAGFEGTVSIPGLDFNLSLPSNVAQSGSYSSDVTYTLATLLA
jgi:hypothetical protein